MDAETEYIEYVISFSLSILAISAVYFLNVSNPLTYISLAMIPLLYGYTAYISRNGFRRSSLFSAISLFFIPLGPIMAVIGILIAVGNPLISVFSGGERFHDYFRAVSIPLLITGLVIGVTGFYMLNMQPGLKADVVNQTSRTLGHQTASMAENTELIGGYQDAQTELIRQTSEASIASAQNHVLNRTSEDLSNSDLNAVTGAFQSAQNTIPDKMVDATTQSSNDRELDSAITGAFRSTLQHPKAELAVIPMATFFLYGLNPLLGILTGLAARFFQFLDRKYGLFPPT